MAIRYTKSYNQQIRNAVKHAQSVEKTLARRGVKLGVSVPKVSELKAKYQTRRELNRELRLLNKLSSSDDKILKEIETSGGATAIQWGLDYLKLNAQKAIEFFEWERKLEQQKNPVYPHEFERINEIEMNIANLKREVDYMNQDEFKAYSGAVKEYFHIQQQMRNGYRGFLYQVETAMRITGFDDDQINSLFNELKKLTPSEFHEWYKSNDLVKRIYELVPSPIHNNNKLTTTEDDAKDLLSTLLDTYKAEIAEIKSK